MKKSIVLTLSLLLFFSCSKQSHKFSYSQKEKLPGVAVQAPVKFFKPEKTSEFASIDQQKTSKFSIQRVPGIAKTKKPKALVKQFTEHIKEIKKPDFIRTAIAKPLMNDFQNNGLMMLGAAAILLFAIYFYSLQFSVASWTTLVNLAAGVLIYLGVLNLCKDEHGLITDSNIKYIYLAGLISGLFLFGMQIIFFLKTIMLLKKSSLPRKDKMIRAVYITILGQILFILAEAALILGIIFLFISAASGDPSAFILLIGVGVALFILAAILEIFGILSFYSKKQ